MGKKIFSLAKVVVVILTALFAVNLSGCASVGPHLGSLKVYRSAEGRIVEQNNTGAMEARARQAVALSNIQNEELSRERAELRTHIAIGNMKLASAQPSSVSSDIEGVVNKEGVIGGFPVLLRNISLQDKILYLKKDTGEMKGYEFDIPLKRNGGQRIINLETGRYWIQWITAGYGSPSEITKDRYVVVHPIEKVWDDVTAKNFHAKVILTEY